MTITHLDIADVNPEFQLSFHSSLHRDLRDLNERLRKILPIGCQPDDDDPLQGFRGLVISDEEATRLLEELDESLAGAVRSPRLRRYTDHEVIPRHEDLGDEDDNSLSHLCRKFCLSPAERQCLVAALAPELDSRYERVFAFLQDDVTRKAPGVELLLKLIAPQAPGSARHLFLPNSTLLRWQFLQLFDRPIGEPCSLLAKGVRLDSRIVAYLLDEESPAYSRAERIVTDSATDVTTQWQSARKVLLDWRASDADTSCRLVFSGPLGVGQRELAEWLAYEVGVPLFWTDVRTSLKDNESPVLVVREAILREAALAVDHAEVGLTDEVIAHRLAAVADLADKHLPLTFLIWNGPWQAVPPLDAADWFVVKLPLPTSSERLGLWRETLAGLVSSNDDTLPLLASRFPLSPAQIRSVGRQFRQAARLGDAATTAEQLQQLCRTQPSTRVPGVSDSEPQRTWSDLVLSADVRVQLEELCSQSRNRSTVLRQWGFAARFSGGKGLNALFSGPPGTGKTLAAEVVAGALDRRLWRIDLAQLVSKYIGETEKNIDRVFRAAGAEEVVLFFDEADALFGRRSEVKDAHDRYANQEVSYLLQQMEEYEGVAVLATNLSRNLDEAFLRRLQFVVDFPFPDEEHRRLIWEVVLPPTVPLHRDVNFKELATAVRLSGGHIRNIAIAAAYLAAEQGDSIGMSHLRHAARREHQKIGQSWAPPGLSQA